MKKINHIIKKWCRKLLTTLVPETNILFKPEISVLSDSSINYDFIRSEIVDSQVGLYTKLSHPYRIGSSQIGDYSYIASNSNISLATIGKFCSIGPNVICGWGIHPTNGLSTSPMFYSTMKQNGISLSESNKIDERKPISIGNDVFIGANVIILDGVTINNGAIIGAGAVVSKDIPPYAIAVGCPIKIIKYRFKLDQIDALLKIKWWMFPDEQLQDVENLFFNVNSFIQKYAD
jgi:acetyltransferase-like isoleucine patch superfamily enzyme